MSSMWDTEAVLSWGRRDVGSAPRRIQVVVVDDLPGYLRTLAELHRFEDVVDVVGRATNTADAVGLIASLEPDLVFMNLAASSGDSLTLAKVILRCLPSVTIVMMSAEDSPRLRAMCLTSGAHAFIHRPAFENEFKKILVSRLSQALDPCWNGF